MTATGVLCARSIACVKFFSLLLRLIFVIIQSISFQGFLSVMVFLFSFVSFLE